jgi:hypothetical protein
MDSWSDTDHRDYGDECQPRASEAPHPATIPDRGRHDADLAPAFAALTAMYAPQDARTVLHLQRLIARLRRQNDALRSDREGVELALRDSAADLAKQDTEIAYLRAMTLHQTRSLVALRERIAELEALHALTGWEL